MFPSLAVMKQRVGFSLKAAGYVISCGTDFSMQNALGGLSAL